MTSQCSRCGTEPTWGINGRDETTFLCMRCGNEGPTRASWAEAHDGWNAQEATFTAGQLRALPTLEEAQTDNLKVDSGLHRVWLARTTVEDGEPYNDRVTIERFERGAWRIEREYQG